jgi:hypothetical protein
MPIGEVAPISQSRSNDLAVLAPMKMKLGFSRTYTKPGWSFSSWALSGDIRGSTDNYDFDSTNVNSMMALGVSANLPVLFHINDGRRAHCRTPKL